MNTPIPSSVIENPSGRCVNKIGIIVGDIVSNLLNTQFQTLITTLENNPNMLPVERMQKLGEICRITFGFRGDLSVVHIEESGTESIQALQKFVTWFMDYEKDRIDKMNNNGPDQISGGYTSLRAKFAHAAGSHNLILDQTSGSISFPQGFLNLFLYPDYSNREGFDDLEPTVKAGFFSTANKIVDQYNRHDDEGKKMFLQVSGFSHVSSPDDKLYVFFGPYSLVFTDRCATIEDTHQESSSIGRRVIGTCPVFPHVTPEISSMLFPDIAQQFLGYFSLLIFSTVGFLSFFKNVSDYSLLMYNYYILLFEFAGVAQW